MKFAKNILVVLSICVGAAASELVPFVLPWDDVTPGPTDLSYTLEKPAGQFGFVSVRNGHLYTGEQRLRLFGVNFTAAACFPDRDTADKVAARLAKFGLNAVRFHFLDSTWGQPRLINYQSGDWSNWDAEALNRLDYFIARLKEYGIYVNLNLLVGRRFGVGDGVDSEVNRLHWKAAHAVGFFHAPHLEAQKAFARRLLTHRNPYTGLAYFEDPAVAMVEINNENGLIHTWLGGGLDDLPNVFADDLRRQWNEWLARRYNKNKVLSKAWGVRNDPLGAEMLLNADFSQVMQEWNVEQHDGAKVDVQVKSGTASLNVREVGSADWHVQLNQAGLAVDKGEVYTVEFKAASDRERQIRVSLMQAHAPWGNLGFQKTITLASEAQKYAFTFIADGDAENARLNFSEMNQLGAEFRFGGLSMKAGGQVGLTEGESLENRNIRLPLFAETYALSDGARQDWIGFLWETERDYWMEMQRFLKDDIGIRAPIVGTVVGTSTPNIMAGLDIIDTHAYWEHPHFPGTPWDRNNWIVQNISMVDYPERATVASLSFKRVAGQPHMVSEYNHPAPNTHAAEGPLFIAAFGALQDWDAIFLYTYSHDEAKTKAGRIPDFFDIGQHPSVMANTAVASLLFRRGDVAAARQLIELPLPPNEEIQHIAQDGYAWRVLNVERLGIDLRHALRHRIALDLTGRSQRPSMGQIAKDNIVSDTGQMAWRLSASDQGVFEIRTPRAKGFLGRVDGQTVNLGDGVEVEIYSTRSGWCTFMLIMLDGESLARNPRRALLVATGQTENTEMGWNEAKSTVGSDWGRPPSLIEPISAILRVTRPRKLPTLYPLNERGQRGKGITFTICEDGAAQVEIGPPHKTLWYEVVWLPE